MINCTCYLIPCIYFEKLPFSIFVYIIEIVIEMKITQDSSNYGPPNMVHLHPIKYKSIKL